MDTKIAILLCLAATKAQVYSLLGTLHWSNNMSYTSNLCGPLTNPHLFSRSVHPKLAHSSTLLKSCYSPDRLCSFCNSPISGGLMFPSPRSVLPSSVPTSCHKWDHEDCNKDITHLVNYYTQLWAGPYIILLFYLVYTTKIVGIS